jgi:hypothetical protein
MSEKKFKMPHTLVPFVEISRRWTYYLRKSAPNIKMVYHRGKLSTHKPQIK